MKKLLALLAVLGLSTVASAAVTWGYDVNPTTTNPDYSFAEVSGYDHYVIYLKVTGDEVVRSFDIAVDTGSENAILQQVARVKIGGVWKYYPVSTFQWSDLTGDDQGRTTVALDEYQIGSSVCKGSAIQNTAATVVGPDDTNYVKYAYGISGDLTDADEDGFPDAMWAITGWNSTGNNDLVSETAGVWDVMNLYLKQGVTGTVDFGVAAGDAGEGIYFQETFTIPEPATIGLLAMGVIGMLRRKLA